MTLGFRPAIALTDDQPTTERIEPQFDRATNFRRDWTNRRLAGLLIRCHFAIGHRRHAIARVDIRNAVPVRIRVHQFTGLRDRTRRTKSHTDRLRRRRAAQLNVALVIPQAIAGQDDLLTGERINTQLRRAAFLTRVRTERRFARRPVLIGLTNRWRRRNAIARVNIDDAIAI